MTIPAKPPNRRKRPTTIDVSYRSELRKILKTVEQEEVPIECLYDVTVTLLNDAQYYYKVTDLEKIFDTPDEVEQFINDEVEKFGNNIKEIDYNLSIDAVAKIVYPQMDKLLEKCR